MKAYFSLSGSFFVRVLFFYVLCFIRIANELAVINDKHLKRFVAKVFFSAFSKCSKSENLPLIPLFIQNKRVYCMLRCHEQSDWSLCETFSDWLSVE